ncbi:MAG: WXG100 family type VII secretion target [Pseudonocardia sp.]
MARVLSSEEARTAITQMQNIINGGLTEQIRSLDTQGQRLSDPNVWDGKLATDFRSQWPETKRALDKVSQELEELRSKVQSINTDIMSAGGNS